MTTETTIVPKSPANATPAAKHGCCGGEAAPESRSGTPERADHAHHEHTAPSKPAQSSCCCGAAKETGPADQKNRSAAPK